MSTRHTCYLLLFTIFLTTCAPDSQDDIVATVGDQKITAERLRTFVVNLLPGLRSKEKGQAARLDYLQTLIDQELLLLGAYSLKLDQDPEFLQKIEKKRKEYIFTTYQSAIHSKVKVSDEEILNYFTSQGWDRERHATAILVETEEEAEQIRQELEAGGDFAQLARQHSLDSRVAQRSGDLDFLARPMAERLLHIPLAVFDTLKTGTVSPPLPYGKSYHLVRFIEDRKADLQTHQGRIKVQLLKQKRELAVEKEVELLAYESDWQLTSGGLALLKRIGETMGERGDLYLEVAEQKTPLFVFKGGAVTVEEFAEILRNRRIKNKRALVDSGFIASIGRRLLLKNAMLYAAAEKAGLPDDPEVVAWFGKFKRNQLLQLVRRRQVIEKITVETEALHEYYEKNKKKYHTYQTICFDEVMVPSRKVALQIREEIDKSTNLLELSYEKNLQVRRRTADGLICLPLHNQNKKAYPELSEALISTPMGELGGPVYTRSGYAIFKKVRDVPARQQSFEEVRKRVRATLAQGLENQHFSDWIERLRQKYHQRVQTFPERLTAALPEALLAGTAGEL